MNWTGNGKCKQETAVSSTFPLKTHRRKVNFVEIFYIYSIYTYVYTKHWFKISSVTLFAKPLLAGERYHELTASPTNPENEHFFTEIVKKWP